jgi:hypothetical protein
VHFVVSLREKLNSGSVNQKRVKMNADEIFEVNQVIHGMVMYAIPPATAAQAMHALGLRKFLLRAAVNRPPELGDRAYRVEKQRRAIAYLEAYLAFLAGGVYTRPGFGHWW